MYKKPQYLISMSWRTTVANLLHICSSGMSSFMEVSVEALTRWVSSVKCLSTDSQISGLGPSQQQVEFKGLSEDVTCDTISPLTAFKSAA